MCLWFNSHKNYTFKNFVNLAICNITFFQCRFFPPRNVNIYCPPWKESESVTYTEKWLHCIISRQRIISQSERRSGRHIGIYCIITTTTGWESHPQLPQCQACVKNPAWIRLFPEGLWEVCLSEKGDTRFTITFQNFRIKCWVRYANTTARGGHRPYSEEILYSEAENRWRLKAEFSAKCSIHLLIITKKTTYKVGYCMKNTFYMNLTPAIQLFLILD